MTNEAQLPTPEFKKPKRSASRRFAAGVIKTTITLSAVYHYGLRDGLDAVRSGEAVAGLIEGAIIAPKLAYVDLERGHLIYKEATNGRLLSYDVLRPKEFPALAKAQGEELLGEGVLWSMLPTELKNNKAEDRTPTGYVEMYDIDHLMTLDKYPLVELMGEQVLRAVSLAEAFDTVGLGEHIVGLERRSIAKDRVYQVTPKGNTLMTLTHDDGDPSPKREEKHSFARVPGLLVHG